MEIGTVKEITIEQEMRSSYIDYAMSVIVARALPDVRDGLKPVHRRILYAMNELSLRHTSPYKKSARIVGEVLGKYHPHGDSAVYDAMVRMAQDFSMRYCLVDGQGNFGSVDGDAAAAMRYTEARLAAIADEMLIDIEKDTVDFIPNFDGSLQEPSVLPAKLPNLLLNGASGIAVGMATNIPPHNLNEVCDGITYLIDHPDATIEELCEIITGPDFPTGGVILGKEGIVNAYTTGHGKIVIRAKAHIEEARGGRFDIIITELPYQVNKASLIEKMAALVKEDKINAIADLRDESDRAGMRIVIELKKDAQPKKILNQLFKYTALQTSFGVNMLALVDGTQPRVLTLKRVLQHYIEYRREVITRRSRYDLGKAKDRAHILEGLKIALDYLDEVIATIRSSQNAETARTNLMRKFKLSEVQAQAILDMQLRRLSALERKKIEEEYAATIKLIAYLEDLLTNPHKMLYLIKKDLEELKEKYGDVRRTRIAEGETGDIADDDLIPDLDVLITLTGRGYIKRLPSDTYRSQRRGGKGITGIVTRESDDVSHLAFCNTRDDLLFFTNRGRVFQLKAHVVPDAGRTAKGLPIINLISIDPKETVTGLLNVPSFADGKYLVIATKGGKIKRTELKEYSAVRSSGLIALNLEPDDELTGVNMTSGKHDLILVTKMGQAIRFSEKDVRPMGRAAVGVNAIKLKPRDEVVAMDVVDPDADLLLVSTAGRGKRTSLSEFPVQSRAGQGVRALLLGKGAGTVAAARVVKETDDLMLISANGIALRTLAQGISRQGRASMGVAVMGIKADDRVASITCITGSGASEDPDGSEGKPGPRGQDPATKGDGSPKRQTQAPSKMGTTASNAAKQAKPATRLPEIKGAASKEPAIKKPTMAPAKTAKAQTKAEPPPKRGTAPAPQAKETRGSKAAPKGKTKN